MHYFLDVAEANQHNDFMCCPCIQCQNNKDYSSRRTLHSQILTHGFMPKYFYWTKHGENGVMMEDNEEVDYDDTTMEELETDAAENEPTDDFGEALRDTREDCDSERERMKFQ